MRHTATRYNQNKKVLPLSGNTFHYISSVEFIPGRLLASSACFRFNSTSKYNKSTNDTVYCTLPHIKIGNAKYAKGKVVVKK
jgi:hypothetical protein